MIRIRFGNSTSRLSSCIVEANIKLKLLVFLRHLKLSPVLMITARIAEILHSNLRLFIL